MESELKLTREQSGMSLEHAARHLNISPGYLHQIERGHRGVDSIRAGQIAEFYKKGRDDLFVPIRFTARCDEKGGEM